MAWCLKKRGRQQRSLKFERSLNSLPIKYTALAGGRVEGVVVYSLMWPIWDVLLDSVWFLASLS